MEAGWKRFSVDILDIALGKNGSKNLLSISTEHSNRCSVLKTGRRGLCLTARTGPNRIPFPIPIPNQDSGRGRQNKQELSSISSCSV